MPIENKAGTRFKIFIGAAATAAVVVLGTQIISDDDGGGTPGACPVETMHVPDGPDGLGGCWPGPETTGVPDGVTLTTYTGPCEITTPGTVIDSKTVNCDLVVLVEDVTVIRSAVNGYIWTPDTGEGEVSVIDTDINATPDGVVEDYSGVGSDNFVVLRSNITGGLKSIQCSHNCDVRDSYVHGQLEQNLYHASGVRLSQNGTLVHNTLWCEAQPQPPEGGCSANQTGYPDGEPTTNWLVQQNLYMANETGNAYCAYGGVGDDKPFGLHPDTATYIRFIDNVFQRGSPGGICGGFGPIVAFRIGNTGNVWTGNVWDTGETVPPTE